MFSADYYSYILSSVFDFMTDILKIICRLERKFGIFSKLDACSFAANIYDDGNLVSIVTDCSPHATHVAGIAAAYHPDVRCLLLPLHLYETCQRHYSVAMF
jgi:hypothetical protein